MVLIIILVSLKSGQNNSLSNQNENIPAGTGDNSLAPSTNNTELVPSATPAAPVSQVAPVYIKAVKLEYMTTEEKAKIGIPVDSKVQVLGRDKDGTILAYKVINSDADIMTKYGN